MRLGVSEDVLDGFVALEPGSPEGEASDARNRAGPL
jgi:hypothetical protein